MDDRVSPDHGRVLRDILRKWVSRIIDGHADHPVLDKFMTELITPCPT